MRYSHFSAANTPWSLACVHGLHSNPKQGVYRTVDSKSSFHFEACCFMASVKKGPPGHSEGGPEGVGNKSWTDDGLTLLEFSSPAWLVWLGPHPADGARRHSLAGSAVSCACLCFSHFCSLPSLCASVLLLFCDGLKRLGWNANIGLNID